MSRRVALVRTDVSEELSASFIRVTRIGELGTWAILVTLMMEALSSSETSVLTRATRRNIPEDAIRHVLRMYTTRSRHNLIWIRILILSVFAVTLPLMRGPKSYSQNKVPKQGQSVPEPGHPHAKQEHSNSL
jgi:hypothetical protein